MTDQSKEYVGSHYIPEFRKTRFDIPVTPDQIVVQGGHRVDLMERAPDLIRPQHIVVVGDELNDEEKDVAVLQNFFANPDWFQHIDEALPENGQRYSKAFYAVMPVEDLAASAEKSPELMFAITSNILYELRQFDPGIVLTNAEAYVKYGKAGAEMAQSMLEEFFAMLEYTAIQLEATHNFYDKANTYVNGKAEFESYSKEMQIYGDKLGNTEIVSLPMMLQKLEDRIQAIKNMTAEQSVNEGEASMNSRLEMLQQSINQVLQGQ